MKKTQTIVAGAILIAGITLMQCKSPESQAYVLEKSIIVDSAAVVTAHPEATRIGIKILRDGGNAVDAAVSVQFALAVCYPVAGNIGGGGFMVYRDSQGNKSALDYREKAPASAYPDMYLDDEGNAISELSTAGHLAAGVPGSVDGMVKAFERYSKLKDWKRLVQPSIDLARNGFKLTAIQARNFNDAMEAFQKNNTTINAFTSKEVWEPGDLFVQEDLAKTLEAIRDQGRIGFYEGRVADQIVEEMKRGNGLITLEDLRRYESVWREPIIGSYDGHTIISMPPPSSGGIILIQMLEMIESHDIGQYGFQSPESVHLMVETERRAYADRAKYLGDPDFFEVPAQILMDSSYISDRMQDFSWSQAGRSEEIDAGKIGESEETTHFSILDEYGNAVSITTTINTGYGSKVVVGGAGFFLNNEMDDFSAKPGVPNFYGLIGAEANKIEAGKRMLSSMTPTIVEKDGRLKLILGTPGGSTIITSVYQVILNILEFGMTGTEAVHSPRFHHQWKPDVIDVESDCLDESTRDQLISMGHEIRERGGIGKVEAILIREDGKIEAVADIRADDHAEGY